MRIAVEVMLVVVAGIGVFTLIRWLIAIALRVVAKLWKIRPRRRDKLGQLEQRLDALEQRMGALEETSKRIVALLEERVAA